MYLMRRDFEQAVENLLCPSHYEQLLFLKNQMSLDRGDLQHHRSKMVADAMRMIQEGSVHIPFLHPDDALDILKEAIRRLQ